MRSTFLSLPLLSFPSLISARFHYGSSSSSNYIHYSPISKNSEERFGDIVTKPIQTTKNGIQDSNGIQEKQQKQHR